MGVYFSGNTVEIKLTDRWYTYRNSTGKKSNDLQGPHSMTAENRRGTVSLRQISGSARSRKVRVDLGEESSFTQFPAPLKVGDASYFLVHGRDRYKLLSTVCPHQGGEVMDEGDDLFTCDGHGWQYDKGEGICVTRPDFRMKSFLVAVQENHLFALVPDE